MTERDQLKELCANLNQRTVTVPPLFVETQEVEEVQEVFQEYAFALVIGEDLVPGAKSWSERYNTPTWFGLWLLMLCVEWGELGSPYIDVSKQASPITYDAVVNALARRFQHASEGGDDKLIKRYVCGIQYVNKEQIRDIQAAVLKVREAKKQKKTKEDNAAAAEEGKGKKGGGKKKAKTELEGEQVVQELHPPPGAPTNDIQKRFEALCLMDGPLNITKNLTILTTKGDYDINVLFPVPQDTCTNSIPKVTMTVTPVKNQGERVVGYLIRFLQHDPQWNPGQMIYTLIRQKHEREKFGSRATYTEPWPQYIHLLGSTNFPLFSVSLPAWYDYVASMQGGTKISFDAFTRNNAEERIDDHKNPSHPKNVCTLDRAIARLRKVGGEGMDPSRFLSGTSTAMFPIQTVRYLPSQVFWDHTKDIGLVSQYFPFAWSDNLVSLSVDSMKTLKSGYRVDKSQVVSSMAKSLPYKTYNTLSYLTLEADSVAKSVSKLFPQRCYQRLVGKTLDKRSYEQYCAALRDASEVCMQKFCAAVQLHGNTNDLPVSHAIKAAIEWLKEYQKTHETISYKREIYDPELDIYSNHIISLVTMYTKFGKVLHPHYALLLHLLFSAYRKASDGMSFNLCIFGGKGDGKSELMRYVKGIGIPTTFTDIVRVTGAADETDTHIHDEIRVIDEQNVIFMVEKAASQDQNTVLKKQIALTEKKLVLKETNFVQVPGQGKMRTSRNITTAQEYSEVAFSNFVPQETPIMDRYHCILLVRSEVPFEEMRYTVDEMHRSSVRELFCTLQFQTMMITKAMSSFAIPCREPFMGLHDDIMARISEALRSWGAVPSNANLGRFVHRVAHAVYVMAIERAAICTWHIPGAKHYGKPYDHSQLIDCAPLLYVTPKMTLRALTMLSSEILKVEYFSILQAVAFYVLNKPYDTTKTPLDYFFEEEAYPVKKEHNPNYDRSVHLQRHKQLADLNYVEINYGIDEVASMISERTKNPHIHTNEVKAILKRMSEVSFVPRCNGKRNGYARQKYTLDDLKDRHKGTQTPKHVLGIDTYQQTINRMCDGINDIYYLDILQKLTAIPPFDYVTFQKGSQLLAGVPSRDIVFLYIVRDKIRSTTIAELLFSTPSPSGAGGKGGGTNAPTSPPGAGGKGGGTNAPPSSPSPEGAGKNAPPQGAGKSELQFLKDTLSPTKEEIDRVWRAFPTTEQRKVELSGQELFLLLFGIREGYIMEPGMPAKYMKRTVLRDEEYPRFASEADLLMLNNVPYASADYVANTIKLVEIYSKKVCVSLMGMEVFDRDILINAFNFATLSAHTKPGKILLGWADDSDTTKLQTVKWTQEEINKTVASLDQIAPPGAVSRTTGITFKRRDVKTSGEEFLLSGRPQDLNQALPSAIEIVGDLEEYAATQQHLICGRPLDEPVMTEEYVRKTIYKGQVGKLDYPNDIIKDQKKIFSVQWEPNSANAFKTGKLITQKEKKIN